MHVLNNFKTYTFTYMVYFKLSLSFKRYAKTRRNKDFQMKPCTELLSAYERNLMATIKHHHSKFPPWRKKVDEITERARRISKTNRYSVTLQLLGFNKEIIL